MLSGSLPERIGRNPSGGISITCGRKEGSLILLLKERQRVKRYTTKIWMQHAASFTFMEVNSFLFVGYWKLKPIFDRRILLWKRRSRTVCYKFSTCASCFDRLPADTASSDTLVKLMVGYLVCHCTFELPTSKWNSIIAINYRLAPQYPFPCGLQDALAACEWLIISQTLSSNLLLMSWQIYFSYDHRLIPIIRP